MKIDVYTSARNSKKHLSVPAGTDLSTVKFPSDLDPDLHTVSPFKASIDTAARTKPTALDPHDVEQQINSNGFAVHGSSIEINVFARPK